MAQVDNPGRMYERFVSAANINRDNWRDPEHDLEAIQLADDADRQAIEKFLLARGIRHFIDAQALALLDTPAAREALIEAFRTGSPEIRAAVVRLVPELIDEQTRIDELVQRIGQCDVYQGLNLTLTQIQSTHPPAVIRAMFARIARDPGPAAVHFAAMLFFLHKLADEPFDWGHRPFFLRFNPGDDPDRRDAFEQLCEKIGHDPRPYLAMMDTP